MNADSDSGNLDSEQPTILPDTDAPAFGENTVAPSTPRNHSTYETGTVLEGFEILDELGRGGMGVVYKARDIKLDRTVALKMVLGGKFATEEEIQRFRIEGESAAKLDHPGIVPIYEIGEQTGNHFFSMKYIEGQPLSDRLEQFQSNERATVELMVKIARAVQHAHQRGVLHRDLKPANVLLNENNEPAITDFGLAKRIDSDSELTKTGLVMGTPGFMAPEQASGRKDITTAADVFSLGSILFWMITGQTPFVGETPFQTVMNTIESETPSLRMQTPTANADLDLICKKAMQKDPADRYTSAAAMANDLQSWLDGELLSVRAPTAMSLASLWIRKNMRMILGSGLTGAICGILVGIIVVMSQMKTYAQREYSFMQLGGSNQTWVSNFSFLRNLNELWSATQFLIVPIVAVSAFSCVLLIRPQTKEANYISAVTSGLIAGIFAFLVGIGWGTIREASIQKGTNDIELLSSAIWLEAEPERELARTALFQRYPGMLDMDSKLRQQLLSQKIRHDQSVGILPGLWWAVCVTLLLTTFPVIATTVLSGALWQEGWRGFSWFGCTWERSAYCLLFFLVISWVLREVRPSALLMIGAMAYFLTGLYLAVREAPWYWRVAMIPGCFIIMSYLNGDMDQMYRSTYNAGTAQSDEQLLGYLKQSNRLLAQVDRSYDRYQAAIGWLYLNDEKQYQFHCRQLLKGFENAYRPEVASRIAKALLLRSDLQSPDQLTTLYEFSKFASTFESDAYARWFFATRALSELRQGNPNEALSWNEKNKSLGKGNAYLYAMIFAVDALAHEALGDKPKAKQSLQQGRKYLELNRESAMQDGQDSGWVNYRVFQILERECKTKLGQ